MQAVSLGSRAREGERSCLPLPHRHTHDEASAADGSRTLSIDADCAEGLSACDASGRGTDATGSAAAGSAVAGGAALVCGGCGYGWVDGEEVGWMEQGAGGEEAQWARRAQHTRYQQETHSRGGG